MQYVTGRSSFLSPLLPTSLACQTCSKIGASHREALSRSSWPTARTISDRPKPRRRTVFQDLASQRHSSLPTRAQREHRSTSRETSQERQSAIAEETISYPERQPHQGLSRWGFL